MISHWGNLHHTFAHAFFLLFIIYIRYPSVILYAPFPQTTVGHASQVAIQPFSHYANPYSEC